MTETKLGCSLAGAAVPPSLRLTKRLLLSYDACLDQYHEDQNPIYLRGQMQREHETQKKQVLHGAGR